MQSIETKAGSISLIYEDRDVIALSKPAGLLSQKSEGSDEASLLEYLSEHTGGEVFPLHRLDRMTSGVMIVAKSKRAAAEMTKIITDGALVKEYSAVVLGKAEGGTLQDLLFFDRGRDKSFVVKKEGRRGVKKASLEYVPLANATEDGRELTLVRVKLHTGRTHQIRVQMSNAGHPLLGDGKYGGGSGKCSTALHSCRITFKEEALRNSYFKKSPLFKALAENPDLISSKPASYPWSLFEA